MLFSDIHDQKGHAKCKDTIISCTQLGVLGAIHPTLRAKAQSRMSQR